MRKVSWHRVGLAGFLALLAVIGMVSPFAQGGADKKEANDKNDKNDKKPVDIKAKKAPPSASSVDFAGSLELGLESLKTLGARIDKARATNDPVSLASLARELAAMEDVADKQASLTAATLKKKAVEMAQYRNRPNELRTVAKLVGDEDTRKKLLSQADTVAKAQKARAKGKVGEKTRGITGYLRVNNYSLYYVNVSINYQFRGTIAPRSFMDFYVGADPYSTTYFYAATTDGLLFWQYYYAGYWPTGVYNILG